MSAADRVPQRDVRRWGARHPLVPVTVGVALYSTGPVLVNASDVTGAVFSFWRLWFGVAALGVAAAVHRVATGVATDGRAWRYAVAAGAAFGVHQLMLFIALKATSVADVTLVNTTSPIVTALLAAPVFGERPGRSFHLWSLVAVAGAAVVVLGATAGPEGDPVGMGLALGNVLFFAVFFLLSKISRDHLATVPFLAGVIATSAVVVTGYVLVAGERPAAAGTTDLVYAFVVAVGPGAVGHFVMTWPLRYLPANIPPVMRLAVPVLAATWAWWFLGEDITWWHVGGGTLTLVGVAGAVSSRAGRQLMADHGDDAQGGLR